ncbi:MAG: polynucleotide adenylyltransferase PcnB [Acidobacteriota bacterium]
MDPRIVPRSEHSISRKQIDSEALTVLYRLHRHGKIAYLVGGGVRDLLLGIRPKDFDVATDARPGEVKRLFRNSWIVGRRFRLVHVVFGKKVVEVATFRAKAEIDPSMGRGKQPEGSVKTRRGPAEKNPEPGSESARRHMLVTWENTFGTPEQDARRRDLTINALFYDIGTYSLIDYVGGLTDLGDQVIRTVGDPNVRFQEDPVRMMRAVKFAARLGFHLDPATESAIRRHAGAITLSARPRVLEEIYRLLGSGKATASFQLLETTGLLPHLFPEVMASLGADGGMFWAHLREMDEQVVQGAEAVSRPVLMATLLYHLVRDLLETRQRETGPVSERVEAVIRPLAARLRLTRADTARIIQILASQRRFLQPRGRRISISAFVRRGYFPDAFQLLRIHAAATGELADVVQAWTDRVRSAGGGVILNPTQVEGGRGAVPRRARRRRRRKSKSRGAGTS